jgi:putative transposase
MAWQHRHPAPDLAHQTDQGNQHLASLYQTLLACREVVFSMNHKGSCYDNAPVESFFSSLKHELVRHRQFQNQAQAQVAIENYINRFIYQQRLHKALGYGSPEEFERQESGAYFTCYSRATSICPT